MIKSEKGFTLVEVLISLLILGIISVGLMNGLSGATKDVHYADSREQAKNIAETQMEAIQNQPFSGSSYSPVACPAGFQVTITTTPVPGNADTNIQKIIVGVQYTNINTGQQNTYILEDFKTN